MIDPCIPADWKTFSAIRKWRGAEYKLTIENPDGVMKGVKEIWLDGKKVEKIPVQDAGSIHEVKIMMG